MMRGRWGGEEVGGRKAQGKESRKGNDTPEIRIYVWGSQPGPFVISLEFQ